MAKLSDYRHLGSGKVRDLYEVDDELLLMVASDRISAFDHILPTEIPDKGRILTAMSIFWFGLLTVGNHLAAVEDARIPPDCRGRALLVRRLPMVPVECVARGYLTGSGLTDYRRTGGVCGVDLPSGLTEASRLPEPIFTPAAKADLGSHDENITFAQVTDSVGRDLAGRLRATTLALYATAAQHAAARGIILADTKFEFGTEGGDLVLADEVLTPDSSRFRPAVHYREGTRPESYDKQFVRDWLTSAESGWDRSADQPPPPLPDEVVAATRDRYVQAYQQLSGLQFSDWPG